MEIEAKFAVPSLDVFEKLRRADQLAGFSLAAGRTVEMDDTYVDTLDRSILAAGYACRFRRVDDGFVVTLKSQSKARGAIHRREEYEISLPEIRPVGEWPVSEVREKVLALIGSAELLPIFQLHQTRIVRPVAKRDRLIAELCLDDVRFVLGRETEQHYELEVELKSEGKEEDLVAMASGLSNEWGLSPVLRSKFQRALVALGGTVAPLAVDPSQDGGAGGALLLPEERSICEQLRERNDLHGKRAMALLELDKGTLQEEAGRQAGLSTRRVRYWLAEFRAHRMGVFPERVLNAVRTVANGSIGPVAATEKPPAAGVQPWSLDMILEQYDVDRTHARTVARFALALFDGLNWVHGLQPACRSLLETMAMVHDVGVNVDLEQHDLVGRDILRQHPPAGLDEEEQQMVIASTWLHRRPITEKNLGKLTKKCLGSLPELEQQRALKMIALVRIADGLDYSEGSDELGRIYQEAGEAHVEVMGSFSSVDIAQAENKSDLWALLFDVPLRFDASGRKTRVPEEADVNRPANNDLPRPATAGVLKAAAEDVPEATPSDLEDRPGLQPDDTMAEAARKTLLFHFGRMLAREAGTRLGEDPEELHDMRVATRRMRAAFPVFEEHLDAAVMRPFLKGLRRTGRALGAVRDLDVFGEKMETYVRQLPPERQGELEPLRRVWSLQRDEARERLITYLDGSDYNRFVQSFGDFLNQPGAGALPVGISADGATPNRVRHVVPVVLYQRLALVRAFDEWMEGPGVPLQRYHQLRIASKGLRYALEYFAEVLGPGARGAVADVKALQDVLGDLQDSVVACNLIRDFLIWGTWGHEVPQVPGPEDLVVAPGAAAYLATRQADLQDLLQRFPDVWARFHGQKFSQKISDAVSIL